MAEAKTGEVSGKVGKDLVNKDGKLTELTEWATQNIHDPVEMLDFFEASGVPVTRGEELTGDYHVVPGEEKAAWCTKHEGERLMAVKWHFYENNQGEFVAVFLVANDGKFILNDSAKGGIYGDLRKITDFREKQNPESATLRTSTAGLYVENGLRRNKPFFYNTETGKSIPKLELNDTVKHPMDKRAESRPTWSFDI